MNTTTSPASQPQAPTDWRALALQYKAPPDGWMTSNDYTLSKLAALAARPATAAAGVQEIGELREGLGNIAVKVMDDRLMLKCCHAIDKVLAALAPQTATQPASEAVAYSNWVWRHTKSGGQYSLLGDALVQTDKPLTDMAEVYVYQGADHRMWVRPVAEFNERFKRVRPATPAQPAPAPGAGKGEKP